MRRLLLVVILGLASWPHRLWATGNDNPTGVMGDYNGQITTGGSYDPYTGNAKRVVTDLEVAGSVGAYPLRWTRTLNTRGGRYWNHSYTWYGSVRIGPKQGDGGGEDFYEGPDAKIGYPQGESVDFYGSSPGYRSNPGGEPGDRLVLRANGNYELLMRDGGVVVLVVSATHVSGLVTTHDLRAVKIIDPFKQETTLSYDVSGRLSRITEPGGRYLQVNYNGASALIGSVQAFSSPGALVETVSYTYQSLPFNGNTATGYLTQVNYADGSLATYTYQAANVWPYTSGLIKTCNDVRFAGPMSKIEYEFMPLGSIPSPDVGQLKAERNATTHQVVSQVTYPSRNDPAYLYDPAPSARTETRGDGETRSFQYGIGTLDQQRGVLSSYTDFKNQRSSIERPYDPYTPYRKSFTDARGKTTHNYLNASTGAVLRTTHPDGSYLEYEYSNMENPRFLTSRSDERRNFTYYDRDAKNRIRQTRYPDGAYEKFEYDANDQVIKHQHKANASTTEFVYDHFQYNTVNQLITRWNPTTNPNRPTAGAADDDKTTFTYYLAGHAWEGRVKTATDQRGNGTTYEYDELPGGAPCPGRGLVTKIVNPDTTFKTFGYDDLGNKVWEENELRQRTTYTYDDYNRLETVTVPPTLEFPAPPPTRYSYAIPPGSSPYTHTTKSVRKTTSPTGIVTGQTFDENFRVATKIEAEGTASAATTWYDYDANGNLTTVTDPRGGYLGNPNFTTKTEYDGRNRKVNSTSPAPFNYLTVWTYDDVGNVLRVNHDVGGADATADVKTYDTMHRVLTEKVEPDPRARVTALTYWPSGMLRTVTDAENHDTTFTYWPSDLKKTMTYNNLDAQQWTYDEALNLTSRRTVGGHYQVFEYDNRNRKTSMGWHAIPYPATADIVWANGVYDCTYAYDAAGRLTDAINSTSSVKRGYDAAGRLQFDRQTFPAIGSKEVQYDYNADGKVNRMVIPPTSYDFNFRYDQRGRLAKYIMGSGTATTYEYVYDAASNVVERENYFNQVSLVFGRDSLNRATRRDVVGPGGYIARESYGYDRLSRMNTVKRELAGRLDRYDYDYVGQLKSAEYDLSWNGSAWVNPASTGNYTWDLVGNRESVTDANGTKAYTSNDVNEYTVVGGKTVSSAPSHQMMSYDGVTYDYISDTYLAKVTLGSNNYQLRYDALGRCVQRTMNGASTYYLFDGDHWIMEFNSVGAELSNVLYGLGIDEIIARGNRGQGQFAIQDWLGSMSMVLGFGGEVLEKYSYDAFGTPTIKGPTGAVRAVSAINNTFMFTSREYQSTFGIYEYRNRAYHPGLGRFTTEDPKGFDAGDYNLFRYCANDPLDRTDPYGLDPNAVAAQKARTPNQPDYTWTMANFFDGANMGQGTLRGKIDGFIMALMQAERGNSQNLAKPTRPYKVTRSNSEKSFTFSRGGYHFIVVPWIFTVTKSGQPVGSGVPVDERVSFSDGVDAPPPGDNKSWTTNKYGQVRDNVKIGFSSEKGHVNIDQEVVVRDGSTLQSGKWSSRVGANGEVSPVKTSDNDGYSMSLDPN